MIPTDPLEAARTLLDDTRMPAMPRRQQLEIILSCLNDVRRAANVHTDLLADVLQDKHPALTATERDDLIEGISISARKLAHARALLDESR